MEVLFFFFFFFHGSVESLHYMPETSILHSMSTNWNLNENLKNTEYYENTIFKNINFKEYYKDNVL